jgi:DNA mismatch endonuclease, patch repair protein
MADVFSPAKRSEIMGRVKSQGNRATELSLVSISRDHKITGWRRRAKVFGSPDFVFRRARLAVFVDGCFWHGCPAHGSIPVNNREFWAAKLERNLRRDRIVIGTLSGKGWRILRIWQHELRNSEQVAQQVKDVLLSFSIQKGLSDGPNNHTGADEGGKAGNSGGGWLAMNCQRRVPVRGSRMRRCQSGNGARGSR